MLFPPKSPGTPKLPPSIGKPLGVTSPKDDSNKFSLGGFGSGFRTQGVSGFDRKFSNFMRGHQLNFKNLSSGNRKEIHDIIANRAKAKTVGSELGWRDKK